MANRYPHKTRCDNCRSKAGMGRPNLDLSKMKCPVCSKIGTIKYIKVRSKAMKKKKWEVDDRVVAVIESKKYAGTIVAINRRKAEAKVLFDDEDVLKVKLEELTSEREEDNKAEEFKAKAFTQYNVTWDKVGVNFRFEAEGGKFYGWWRKTKVKEGGVMYAIDLHVEYKGHKVMVKTIGYTEDPRKDLKSLNADLCAAANLWFYRQCDSTFETIEEVMERANKPTVTIRKMETIDKILIQLKEYRDTAIRCGGRRVFMFTGDDPDNDPSGEMRIDLDLTPQSIALEGRVPSLHQGVMLDNVADDKSKKKRGRGKALKVEGSSENIQALLKKLDKTTDKTEARKLRGQLRKMGHTGGARTKTKK